MGFFDFLSKNKGESGARSGSQEPEPEALKQGTGLAQRRLQVLG